MSGEAQRHSRLIQITARGAVLLMLVVFGLGLLGASWLHWQVLAGAAFLIGSVTAALYARQADLLAVTVTPPLLFCIVLIGVKAVTATGNMALSTAEGTAITLAGAAPWLFAGMALALVIAWARGLRGCVRELRQDLRAAGRPATDRPATDRPAADRPAADRRADATVGPPPSAAADVPPPGP